MKRRFALGRYDTLVVLFGVAWKAPPRLKRCPSRCATLPAGRRRSPLKKQLLIRADLLEKGPCLFAIHDLSHSCSFVVPCNFSYKMNRSRSQLTGKGSSLSEIKRLCRKYRFHILFACNIFLAAVHTSSVVEKWHGRHYLYNHWRQLISRSN